MNSVPTPYRLAVAAARAVAPVLARTHSKLGRGMAGRRDAHHLLRRWADAGRRPEAPLAWFHAPSVGEGLQARAVMEALRTLHPNLQVVYTYFSPSAEPLGERFGADFAGYLPWDQEPLLGPVLDAVRPDLLVFTKTEVWPVLAAAAHARAVPVVLAAGTVPPEAGRLRWPARSVLERTWKSLSGAFACSDDDAGRLRDLGVPPSAIEVTGDPGIDASAERAGATDSEAGHLAPFLVDPKPTVVAGSTWPADEAVLMPALHALRERLPSLRVVLAPHEPTEDRVGSLIGAFMERGWHPSTLAHVEADGIVGGVNAIIVERVGVLADLYAVGDLAFVGGGFHDAGLHSVLEPAAAGLPVVFGPRHRNARAAAELAEAGAAVVVSDSDETANALARWLEDSDARRYAADEARGYIEKHRGAAQRTALELSSLMDHLDGP
ncbi:MAG: glycosyltransferase N-terminal domain-containing protein [Gemmatimonadota bacterium]|nr:glycosyltransferase N-terminal domain-containing protein [Gemmatimonadota bacterium]